MIFPSGFFKNTMPKHNRALLPYRTIVIFCGLWVFIALVNGLLIKTGHATGTTIFFPISIFQPGFHGNGIPYAGLFAVCFIIGISFCHRMKTFHIWALGLLLLILGNMIQGGFEEGFRTPVYASEIQYYHDVINIHDAKVFLANFNDQQATFLDHTRTHPPFAVLFMYYILRATGGSIAVLAAAFTLLSSFTLIVIRHVMIRLGNSPARASRFALLYAVIPAFNIYGAVSLDGVIAMFAAIWVLGATLVMTNHHQRTGIFLAVFAIIFMNAVTFLGAFLVAATILAAIRERILHRRYRFATILGISLVVGAFFYLGFKAIFGYDHFMAFFTASHIENPDGFLAVHAPLKYIMTRLEDIFEIGLFLSVGVLGVCFRPDFLLLNPRDIRDEGTSLYQIGICVLLLMFLTGALRTGETARACLFIYPFFFLLLRKVNDYTLQAITITAGIQTAVMQLFGFYFW